MSLAHWTYLTGIVLLIFAVVAKKNVVPLAVGATFVTALTFSGSLATALVSVFNAGLTAAGELFQIFLIIALVTAMLGAMKAVGADRLMVQPFQRLMRNGHVAYAVIALVSYVLSLVFWPTPVIALIGAILVPAAVRVGLTPFGCAMAVAITGQGMALASDYVLGVAPSLSAQGAQVPAEQIGDRAMVISLIAGVVALGLAYLRDVRGKVTPKAAAGSTVVGAEGTAMVAAALRPLEVASARPQAAASAGTGSQTESGPVELRSHGGAGQESWRAGQDDAAAPQDPASQSGTLRSPTPTPRARAVAVAVPLAFAGLLVYMLLARFSSVVPDVSDGIGAPLVGGTAAVLLVMLTFTADRRSWMDACCDHFVDGLTFAFKNMGMVIPVAGFIYIGLSDYSPRILGLPEGAEGPGFLLDAVSHIQPYIPGGTFFAAFAMLLVGMIIGLDGSGWPGLPFAGSMAHALGQSSGADTATLAAIAQNGAGWTGGGTLVIWSSLIVVAGVTGVPVAQLARRLFLPVVAGLVVATAFAAAVLA